MYLDKERVISFEPFPASRSSRNPPVAFNVVFEQPDPILIKLLYQRLHKKPQHLRTVSSRPRVADTVPVIYLV